MPDSGEHEGTYVSTVTGFNPDPSGTLVIQKSGGPTQYYYTPTGGAQQEVNPSNHGQTLTFSITISGTTYTFNGTFSPTGGGHNKRYSGTVSTPNSVKETNGTWTASSQTPVPTASRKAS
jgi:hypothetical protein